MLMEPPKRVLVAHQSTIPHYRVPFYQAVQRLKPADWTFAVVHDVDARRHSRIFAEPVGDDNGLGFPIEPVTTVTVPGTGGAVRYQTFFRRARHYHLLVLEDAFHNLTYPLVRLQLAAGVRIAYWGHGRDLTVTAPRGLKAALERIKLRWARGAAGYLAYTAGVRDFLAARGVDPAKIFVLDNTIDIESHRRQFLRHLSAREDLRRQRGWQDRRVLLFVGRVNRLKRLDYLAATVAILRQGDPSYLLALVGTGDAEILTSLRRAIGSEGFEHLGVETKAAKLAPLFVQSDAYVLPGLVGLGPLMALCYDLTPVVIDSPTHSPEREYLCADNAVILAAGAPPDAYAARISAFLEDPAQRSRLRQNAWPSIRHLTIDNMAANFITGVNAMLAPHHAVEK